MTRANNTKLVERLTRRHVCREGNGNTTVHHIINPDGPEAAALINRYDTLLRRWGAIDGGSWDTERYASERADLLAETRTFLGGDQ